MQNKFDTYLIQCIKLNRKGNRKVTDYGGRTVQGEISLK